MMLVITSDREASPIRMRQMDDRSRLPPALVLGLPARGDEGNPQDGVHLFEPLARGGCDADRRRAPMDDLSALPMSDEPPPRCR
jgi:hypothetical protein